MLSSHFGFSLSTTHVATGSILGSGVGMKGASVRWSLAGRMFTAWLITVPAAGLVGAASFGVSELFSPYTVFGLLIVMSLAIVAWSRIKPVNHSNVNDAWEADADPASVVAEVVVDHESTYPGTKARKNPRKFKWKW